MNRPSVLVINSGSSSIKYQLIDIATEKTSASGLVERIGEAAPHLSHAHAGRTIERDIDARDHRAALDHIISVLDEVGPRLADSGIVAVGHRVVMGGRDIDGPVLIDSEVLDTIERVSPLAPLHNPANLATIVAMMELFPGLPHVAVFDTAFFHDLPAAAALYAIDHDLAERHGVRRYGFHGTSHQYVAAKTADVLGRSQVGLRQIVLHLGNGASASAVVDGRAVDTSMGLTPLEGLVMGTRAGDIDPAVVFHLARVAGMDLAQIDQLLNKRSGMLGLTGASDMREVHRLVADGNPEARVGLDVYVHRIKKYLGAYTAIMGGLDTLTFTAGVGEHDAIVRSETTADLEVLGITVANDLNSAASDQPRVISPPDSTVTVLVVPTNEELAIARQVISLIG